MTTVTIPNPPTELQVQMPYDGTGIDLVWTDEDNGVCGLISGYHVYKSAGGGVPIRLTNDPITTQFYRDPEARYAPDVQFYYQVSAVNAAGESELTDPPITVAFNDYGELEWVIPEFIRRNETILGWDSETATMFLRKRAGIRCHCWDECTGQAESRCETCFGTGVEGGYDPFEVQIRYIEATQKLILRDGGWVMDNRPRFWTGTFPLFLNDDIVARQNGERYFVQDKKNISTRGIITRQEGSLFTIPSKEIEYRL